MTGRRIAALGAVTLLLAGCATVTRPESTAPARQVEFSEPAAGLPAQTVTVWLPPGYDAAASRRYPVLYMWDGQNLFDPARAHYGKAWMVQDVMAQMAATGRGTPHIVVGIHSPPGRDRYRVYLPQKVAERIEGPAREAMAREAGGPFAADRQLAWVADTLKPRIDRTYRTRRGAHDTTVVGASMGGLMACYALIERPDVFGRAGCVSIPFAPLDPAVADPQRAAIEHAWAGYIADRLGLPRGRRAWLDHGTAGMDAAFAPWQAAVARDLTAAGWREGTDFTARVIPGAEHDENFWRARMPEMLAWLWRE